MKKKVSLAPVFGPTPERLRNSSTEIEAVTGPGAVTLSRHRVRPILTPFPLRHAIITEAADKPADARIRSLRRRLTPLDRILDDPEALSLDRMMSCINGLSNVGCVNYFQSNVKSDPFSRLPFGERKRREIAALAFVNDRLSPSSRLLAAELACRLDPSAQGKPGVPDQEWLSAVKGLAASAALLYRAFDRSHAQTCESSLAARA